jgi:acyl carrier protein
MSIRATITSVFAEVATEQDKPLRNLSDETPLLEAGLDSLCLAIIVARLDEQLGLDPFNTSEDSLLPVTFGDFIRLYENASA